jgi:hypothetical protein
LARVGWVLALPGNWGFVVVILVTAPSGRHGSAI